MVEEQVLTRTQALREPQFRVEVISDAERFYGMGAEWDRLVERANVDRLFVSHAWLRTWWEAFGNGKRLHVVTVRSGGELVGAAPLMRSRGGVRGLKVNSIQSFYNPHTPRYDFIIAAGHEDAVYHAIWQELVHDRQCEMIVLAQVPDNSRTLNAIRKYAQRDGWRAGYWDPPPSPYISLGCGYEGFVRRLKGSFNYNLRKRQEKLAKLGSVDVEVISERGAVRDALRDGLRIEAAAWKGDEGTAILSDPAVTEFYVRLAERQADLGQLRLSFLRIGGKRISFNYLLRCQQTFYGVKIGYDPEYHTYSPGNTLLNLILQDACAGGARAYDFLGINDRWKLDWTKDLRPHSWLFLYRNQPRARLLHYLKFKVVPVVRPRLQKVSALLRNGTGIAT